MLCPDSLTGIRIGCIGCGTMGSAILSRLTPASHPENGLILSGYNRTPERLSPLKIKGIRTVDTIPILVQQNDIVILGVTPTAVTSVLKKALPFLRPGHLVISLAAGVTQATLKQAVEYFCPVVRIMPNASALVGTGLFAVCLEDTKISLEQSKSIMDLFSLIGTPIVLPEKQFNAFTALLGCGPAYIFYFMEALIEASVTLGFSRQQSSLMVKELFTGSANLASCNGNSPSMLREHLCSPGGITITATNYMDRTAVRGNIIEAILTAYKKHTKQEHIQG